jgi:hypothetical protein
LGSKTTPFWASKRCHFDCFIINFFVFQKGKYKKLKNKNKKGRREKGIGSHPLIVLRHLQARRQRLVALKEPSKRIDGRVTVTQLTTAGNTGGNANANTADLAMRKIYVWVAG